MKKETKLHLGCGLFYLKGYINIDRYSVSATAVDRAFDCNNPLDYSSGSISEILLIHSFEHLKRIGLNSVVKSWYRVLKPKGKLIIEVPDMGVVMEKYKKAVLNKKFGTAKNLLRWVFGNQEREGQYHFWGWTPETITFFLKKFGFSEVKAMKAQNDTRPEELCFRVEATK